MLPALALTEVDRGAAAAKAETGRARTEAAEAEGADRMGDDAELKVARLYGDAFRLPAALAPALALGL